MARPQNAMDQGQQSLVYAAIVTHVDRSSRFELRRSGQMSPALRRAGVSRKASGQRYRNQHRNKHAETGERNVEEIPGQTRFGGQHDVFSRYAEQAFRRMGAKS